MLRKILSWAVVIFLIYWMISKPAAAGASVHNLAHWLSTKADSLSTFMSNL